MRNEGEGTGRRGLYERHRDHPEIQRMPLFSLAEAVGFEPTNGYPLLVFKTSAFNHSATLPLSILQQISRPLP